jgi:hypothetical protein
LDGFGERLQVDLFARMFSRFSGYTQSKPKDFKTRQTNANFSKQKFCLPNITNL